MRTTVNLDEDLLRQAQHLSGLTERFRSFPQLGPDPRKTRLAALQKPVAIAFSLATGFCNASGLCAVS
jgi:hypothetical protein